MVPQRLPGGAGGRLSTVAELIMPQPYNTILGWLQATRPTAAKFLKAGKVRVALLVHNGKVLKLQFRNPPYDPGQEQPMNWWHECTEFERRIDTHEATIVIPLADWPFTAMTNVHVGLNAPLTLKEDT